MTIKIETNILAMFDAMQNCIKAENWEWCDKHEQRIIDVLEDVLPHGSGIDCDWSIDIDKKIVCSNSYHRMDEHGYYCGWIDFQVTITPGRRDIFGNIVWKVSGKFGRHQDIKEYLEETIVYALENL